MAAQSGLYVLTFRDALDTSDLEVNFLLDSHRIALATDSTTPNFDTDTAYANLDAELSTAGNYVAGGKIITGLGPTWGLGNAGQLKYDLTTDQSWASASFSAEAAFWYADALTTPVADAALFMQDFGAPFTATNGTFTIQLAAGGAFTIDLVP